MTMVQWTETSRKIVLRFCDGTGTRKDTPIYLCLNFIKGIKQINQFFITVTMIIRKRTKSYFQVTFLG